MLAALIFASVPMAGNAADPDRNATLVAEGLHIPVEAVTRVTRCNIGRALPNGNAATVNSCYLAVLLDRIVFLSLIDKKPARFRTLVSMPFGEIKGVALYTGEVAPQLQLHFGDDIYGVDVMSNMLFRDGKRRQAVFEDLKSAGVPETDPVDWIQTMSNPGVPFTIPIG